MQRERGRWVLQARKSRANYFCAPGGRWTYNSLWSANAAAWPLHLESNETTESNPPPPLREIVRAETRCMGDRPGGMDGPGPGEGHGTRGPGSGRFGSGSRPERHDGSAGRQRRSLLRADGAGHDSIGALDDQRRRAVPVGGSSAGGGSGPGAAAGRLPGRNIFAPDPSRRSLARDRDSGLRGERRRGGDLGRGAGHLPPPGPGTLCRCSNRSLF